MRHGEQVPFARYPLELVYTSVLELDPGASDEVSDRTRDQHLAGLSMRGDPGAGMHRNPCDLSVDELTFAGVEAGTHIETELEIMPARTPAFPDASQLLKQIVTIAGRCRRRLVGDPQMIIRQLRRAATLPRAGDECRLQ